MQIMADLSQYGVELNGLPKFDFQLSLRPAAAACTQQMQ